MIISDTYKYVYIGIPRTGSKSMNHWLCEHFDGRSHGGHHDYLVPDEAAGYLVFTIVRNPYDRTVSGQFAVTWGSATPQENEPPWEDDTEAVRSETTGPAKLRARLKPREKWEQKPMPVQSSIPLDQRLREAVATSHTKGHGMTQKCFVDLSRTNLVLYFERLPQCLTAISVCRSQQRASVSPPSGKGNPPCGHILRFFPPHGRGAGCMGLRSRGF